MSYPFNNELRQFQGDIPKSQSQNIMEMTRFSKLILLDINYLTNPKFSFRQNSIIQTLLE